MSVILVLRRQRQEDGEFLASLAYISKLASKQISKLRN